MLEKVFPGTSAADGDFKAGDVILAIGGAKVTGVPMFLKTVAEAPRRGCAHTRRGP